MLQSCGAGAEQKIISVKADSLFIRVRCVKTVCELIETTLLLPTQKKLQNKMEYISETYPDTISNAQAKKILRIKDISESYDALILVSRQLQKQAVLQLEQVSKLNTEIAKGKNENIMQYLTFENKCADTLNTVLDALVKKSIELGCKSQGVN
jgi:hypothetical protein